MPILNVLYKLQQIGDLPKYSVEAWGASQPEGSALELGGQLGTFRCGVSVSARALTPPTVQRHEC